MNNFDLIIGNNMLKIDSIVIDLNVLLYHNKKECIQSIIKFVFDIGKIFNNKEFKAFYVFNESKYFDSEYFNIYFDDLFYSISYEQFYQLLLSLKHDTLSSMKDIAKWIENDYYPDIIIDDFRDFLELEQQSKSKTHD
jgi:hypothetical protein